jgi:Zn-dependent protease with chaperone function
MSLFRQYFTVDQHHMSFLFRFIGFFTLLLLLGGPLRLQAQTPQWYYQFQQDSTAIPPILSAIQAKHRQQLSQFPGKDARYAKEFYEERELVVKREFELNAVILDDTLNRYLKKLLTPIYQANPSIPQQQLRVFFSRDFVPNACSYGDGTILFNIGLFYRLDNEAQAAFVLCHELSHYLLGHSEQQIRKYVNTFYSDSMQQVLKKVSKQSYNGMAEIRKLVEEQLLLFRRHNRENERQADSLAIRLLQNTPYLVSESMTCLALLDGMDSDPYRQPLDLPSVFDFPEFPFRQKWLRKEENIFANVQQVKDKLSDSLKTHPDCKHRISVIQSMGIHGKGSQRFLADSVYFIALKMKMEWEMAGYAYASGNVSRAMYYSLNLAQKYPTHTFPVVLTGQCMNALYDAMIAHRLRTIAELPGLKEETGYDYFKIFLENIRAADMASLSYYYHQKYQDIAERDPTFSTSQNKSKIIFSTQNLK